MKTFWTLPHCGAVLTNSAPIVQEFTGNPNPTTDPKEADTMAACGAFYGSQGILEKWRIKFAKLEMIEQITDDLCKAGFKLAQHRSTEP